MGLSRRQFIVGAAGAGLILLSNPLPKIFPAWGSSLAFGAGIKYVSNRTSAGGNGTLGNPYQVSEIWSNAVPGDEFIFLDGLYRGSDSMLDVDVGGGEGKSGTAQAWITLRAETDGQVTFDGQFARVPMRFAGNKYLMVTGFNACRSNGAVVTITKFSNGTNVPCSWMQLTRICAWDANSAANVHTFSLNYGANILVEDCASWGIGRKSLEVFGTGGFGSGTSGGYGFGGTTVRRHWASWNSFGGGAFGPRHTYSLTYNYTNVLAENIIGTWDTEPGAVITSIYDIIGNDGFYSTSDEGQTTVIPRYLQLYGSLAYLRQNQSCPVHSLVVSSPGGQDATFKDVYSCIEPGANHTTKKTFLNWVPDTGRTSSLNGLYTIKNGTASVLVPTRWTYANINEGGPRVLPMIPKYVDGVKTGTPLFPWPMNQRIIDARIQSGRSAVDVTATVQQVLGNGAGDTMAPQAPENLRAS